MTVSNSELGYAPASTINSPVSVLMRTFPGVPLIPNNLDHSAS